MLVGGPPRGAVDPRRLIVDPLLGAVGPSLLLFAPWEAVARCFLGEEASSVPRPAVMREVGVLDERSHSTALFLPREEPGRSFRVSSFVVSSSMYGTNRQLPKNARLVSWRDEHVMTSYIAGNFRVVQNFADR